jgi:hypothetical protein
MRKTNKALTITALAAITIAGLVATLGGERRVVSHNWSRTYNGVTATHSGKRVFWPKLDRKQIIKMAHPSDQRHWSPPNSKQRYWVVLSDGTEEDVTLAEWSRLERGSPW